MAPYTQTAPTAPISGLLVSVVDAARSALLFHQETTEKRRSSLTPRGRGHDAIIRGAADGDTFAADLRRRLLRERLAQQTGNVALSLDWTLHPGLSVQEAGQHYCALSSPELHQLLTVDLGWAVERYEAWLAGVVEAELLQAG